MGQKQDSEEQNCEQDLIFFVAEWQWYVKFWFLLNFRLFLSFSMKKIIFFLFCFYLTEFCADSNFILVEMDEISEKHNKGTKFFTLVDLFFFSKIWILFVYFSFISFMKEGFLVDLFETTKV